MNLEQIDQFPLSGLIKGMPNGLAAFPLREIGRHGWNILKEDLPLPVAVLKASALDHNDRWMESFLRPFGAAIAPHGKTTMSPQLFERQLANGAWAMTVATTQQIEVCIAFGVTRVILANQLVGRQAIRYVVDLLSASSALELYCLADSVEGVALLRDGIGGTRLASPLNIFLEIGNAGGRTGCRDLETALAVARAVKAGEPNLRLRGVEAFEGLIQGATPEDQDAKIRDFLDSLVRVGAACAQENLFSDGPIILSAGGSAFYDLVVERFARADYGREIMVLTRSGCYLSHDSGLYRRDLARARKRSPSIARLNDGLQPALQVWAYVQSRPEPGKAILTMGKRDVSYDPDLPVPELWYRPMGNAAPEPLPPGYRITGLNDQHAHMSVPENSPLRVGDMVAFGISHPCLTFDKWQVLCVVDDHYNVISAVKTFF